MTRSAVLLGVIAAASAAGCASREALPARAPFVHMVLFKTASRAPDASAELVRDIETMLADLPTVKGLWIGKPAPTDTRPIVDVDYDIGLLVLFQDVEGLQEYLDHPIHVRFAEKHDTRCTVRVFDFTR